MKLTIDNEIFSDKPDKYFYKIAEVVSMVGVEAHVLRYWEKEFLFKPFKSGNKHRKYQKKDIIKFIQIKKLLYEKKYTLEGAKKILKRRKKLDIKYIISELNKIKGIMKTSECSADWQRT